MVGLQSLNEYKKELTKLINSFSKSNNILKKYNLLTLIPEDTSQSETEQSREPQGSAPLRP